MKEEQFKHSHDIKREHLQMSKYSSSNLDVIVVYRSQEMTFRSMKILLQYIINLEKNTLIVGDFNFCFLSETNYVSKYLAATKFNQLVKEATHIDGAILDHIYFRSVQEMEPAIVELFSTYYSDHDMVTVLILEA